MIITTSARADEHLIHKAKQIAVELDIAYTPRQKQPLASFQQTDGSGCFVLNKHRLELYSFGSKEPFFFHPNSASFRIKRLMRGEKDPFIEAAQINRGMSLLDCTLGMASDSITASFAVGSSGMVAGIEGSKSLAYVVSKGLREWESSLAELNEAMRTVNTIYANAETVLRTLPANAFDIVYFDPMFEEAVMESDGIARLRDFAVYSDLTSKMVQEACRVAAKRVVLKDHFRSSRFQSFGFTQHIRKSSAFHYGTIDC